MFLSNCVNNPNGLTNVNVLYIVFVSCSCVARVAFCVHRNISVSSPVRLFFVLFSFCTNEIRSFVVFKIVGRIVV